MRGVGARPARIAVASEHPLVRQTVGTALAAHGLDTAVIPWPRAPLPEARQPQSGPFFDAGLMLTGLDLWSRLRSAQVVMSRVPTRWIVLTEAERGPLWGAALTYGARAVLPIETPMEEVLVALEQASRGIPLTSTSEQDELRAQWRELFTLHEELMARFRTLTPREREVLWQLYLGDSVSRISMTMQVSLSTVRSQVKSILRKLHVNNQLAAVAAMRDYLELDAPRALLALITA